MGSKEFQTEYIQYLQEHNTKLMKKLSELQENFENRVCSTDISKQSLLSTLAETLNICTILPQEIDLFFEKMTGAINTLKNVLIIKSELVQLAEKISQLIKPYKNVTNEISEDTVCSNLVINPHSVTSVKKEKGGTLKVAPMIDGHVISTEPKIYLNRISNKLTGKQGSQPLSPIVETSTTTFESPSSDVYCLKELRIPLQKLQIFPDKREKDEKKKRYKLPKNWKTTLAGEKQSNCHEITSVNETSEIFNKQNKSENQNVLEIDPLEGPSWLYADNFNSSTLPNENFVNKRRRKNLFSSVVCKVENMHEDRSENESIIEPLIILEEGVTDMLNEKIFDKDLEDLCFGTSSMNKMESSNSLINEKIKTSLYNGNSQPEETHAQKEVLDSKLKDRILKRQPVVKLEDCLSNKNISPEFTIKLKNSIKSEKFSDSIDFKNDFCNRSTSDETDGRKKRKAAPTNLAEPSVKIKLRRN